MARLPGMQYADGIRKNVQTVFGGYNHTYAATDGEIYDMKNMGGQDYPLLATRRPRWNVTFKDTDENTITGIKSIFYADGMVIATWGINDDYGNLYYKGRLVYNRIKPCVTPANPAGSTPVYTLDGAQMFAWMRPYVVIFPDKLALDIRAKDVIASNGGNPQLPTDAAENDVYAVPVTGKPYLYDLYYAAWNNEHTALVAEYLHPQVQPLEADWSGDNVKFTDGELYGAESEMNTICSNTNQPIDWNTYFKAGDAIEITGSAFLANNKTAVIREIDGGDLRFDENCFEGKDRTVKLKAESAFFTDDTSGSYLYTNGPTGIAAGTVIEISGCAETANNKRATVIEAGDQLMSTHWLKFKTGTFVPHIIEKACTLAVRTAGYSGAGVTIRRVVPELDGVFECDNRLWGYKGDTIYASKLGDPFNWNVFDGLATDSWAVETGGAGDITGGITYQGYPTFFKQDRVIRVYGTQPSNFQLMSTSLEGIYPNCGQSLAIAGEVLFYVGRRGVMAYSGGVPRRISRCFGEGGGYTRAVGVSDGTRYYVNTQSNTGGNNLFVYDTETGLWHREDNKCLFSAVWDTKNILMLDYQGNTWSTDVRVQDGSPQETIVWAPESSFDWSVTFGDIIEGSPNRKGISKLQIRYYLKEGSCIKVYIAYDGGNEELVGEITETGKHSVVLPVIPTRADHYSLKLKGNAGATHDPPLVMIYSIARQYYEGSELF